MLLIKLRRQKIFIIIQKIFIYDFKSVLKIDQNNVYFFNLFNLFKIVLLFISFYAKMHIKMIYFVNKFIKLYYFKISTMFIKAYFEKYIKNQNNSFMIFLFNIIYYRYNKSICYCLITINIKFHFKRIYAINKDYINITNFLKLLNSLLILFIYYLALK